jgi:hypothetical protein
MDESMPRPKITQEHGTFSMSCAVELNIRASAEILWQLLTDAGSFPRWNSTVTRIDGDIRDGERIRIHAPGTDRTFAPKISGMIPNRRMSWIGGMPGLMRGVRVFQLAPRDDGSTDFTMRERFSGIMLPLARRSMPDFGPVFERYANDLRREAERLGAGKPSGPE